MGIYKKLWRFATKNAPKRSEITSLSHFENEDTLEGYEW